MKIKKLFSLATLTLGFCLALVAPRADAQTALSQTTLTNAVTASATSIVVGSVTGMLTRALPGSPTTIVYVGNEAMGVTSINTTTGQLGVIRGYLGTRTAAHPAADMVLYGNVTPQFTAFYSQDPPFNGGCTASATLSTPWINVLTGAQWLCSTVTTTWVPGWNNPLAAASPHVTAAVASAAGLITPSGPMFHVTGTAAITGFNIPVGFNATAAGGGCFVVIPDGVFTYTAANNIGLASTGLNAGTAVVVVNQPITFCWDATNSKFLPNTQ
jgi:hypothetical protein